MSTTFAADPLSFDGLDLKQIYEFENDFTDHTSTPSNTPECDSTYNNTPTSSPYDCAMDLNFDFDKNLAMHFPIPMLQDAGYIQHSAMRLSPQTSSTSSGQDDTFHSSDFPHGCISRYPLPPSTSPTTPQTTAYPRQWMPTPHNVQTCRNPAQEQHQSEDSTSDYERADSTGQSYAQQLYRALLAAPDYTLTLQELYQCIKSNKMREYKKGRDVPTGWENSVRHNLSMNGAFVKIGTTSRTKPASWRLAERAIHDGILSTTRYRKSPKGKGRRNSKPAPARQRSGAKGGNATKKATARRKREVMAQAIRQCVPFIEQQPLFTCSCLMPTALPCRMLPESEPSQHGYTPSAPAEQSPNGLDEAAILPEEFFVQDHALVSASSQPSEDFAAVSEPLDYSSISLHDPACESPNGVMPEMSALELEAKQLVDAVDLCPEEEEIDFSSWL